MSLWTTYIYYWKWILYESTDIKDSGIKEDLISYPLFYENLNFHVMLFPKFLHFGLWAKKVTLKASLCSHIVILYSFNLLVCKPCCEECPSGLQVLILTVFLTVSVLYTTATLCSFYSIILVQDFFLPVAKSMHIDLVVPLDFFLFMHFPF